MSLEIAFNKSEKLDNQMKAGLESLNFRHNENNTWLKYLLFSSAAFASCITVLFGNAQAAIAYQPHEFQFISGMTGFAGMSQRKADATCKANFQDMRQQGIFNQRVADNTWHIWAHMNNQHCIMNIRIERLYNVRDGVWTPSNNRDKSFPVRIPLFR